MRTNLQVPFAEKDAAKQLGARWDPARKVWYVENKPDLSPFTKWLPKGETVSPNAMAIGGSEQPATARKQPATGITIIGSRYVELPRVCNCLPWDECATCRAQK